ncbi:hypothetical protein BK809_0000903 [Diplodia seriata]|uniref:ABM domain-containing protein n=1 Tax=Diplodia seriata TaxID=420778 RepID=A0A1S8B5M8_9PEZI|nr:hypothetical protein BK809_0000903 [Diplodia seriata]
MVIRPFNIWIEFRVPESEPIFETGNEFAPNEARQKWVDTVCPLTEASGFEGACWSRFRDDPERVALCVRWASREALEAFKESPGYDRYWKGISAFSKPEETELEGRCHPVHYLTGARYPSLLRVPFPHPVDPEKHEKILRLNGFINDNRMLPMPWRRQHQPWQGAPSLVWALSPQMRNGKLMDMAFWFHSWSSPEEEEKYKTTPGKNYSDGFGEVLPRERLDRKLREFGASEWQEEHFQAFKRIPKRFNGEPTNGRFMRNGREIFA